MGVFGDTLRQARAHKGVTLREAEVATRINRHWLLALEEEHFDQLPALIYQRGIVRNYATYLNLDQAKLLQLFSDARGDRTVDDVSVLAQPTNVAPAQSFVPNFAVIAFVVVAMGAMFAWGYSAYFAGADPNGSGQNSSISTATPLNDEERFIATNTPVPPTNTPAATTAPTTRSTTSSGSSRTTIVYPTTTTTPASISIDDGTSNGAGQIDDGQSAAANGERSYSFYAIAETDLLIVVDNVVQWQQPLGPGQATGYLTGSSFVVSISGADSIVVLDGNGVENTYNGPQFTLP